MTNEIKGKMCRLERQIFEDVLASKGVGGNCLDWRQDNVWYISQLLRDMAPLEGEDIAKQGFKNETYK